VRSIRAISIIFIAFLLAAPSADAESESRTRVTGTGNNLVQDTVRKASRLRQAGKPDEAINVVSNAVKNAADTHQAQRLRTIEVNLRLGRVLDAGKGKEKLGKELDALLEHASGLDKEKAFLFCGRANLRIGNYDEARTLLNRYLEEHPEPSRRELRQFREAARKRRGAAKAAGMSHPRLLYRYWATQVLWKVNLVGEPVPDFELTTLTDKQVTPKSFQGKVLLINIWKSSSPPCTSALPGLKELYRSNQSEGMVVLGLSLDRSEAALRGFLKEHELPWPQVHLDEKRQEVSDQFFVQTIPSTYLVDRKGILRGVDLRGSVLRQKLKEVMGE